MRGCKASSLMSGSLVAVIHAHLRSRHGCQLGLELAITVSYSSWSFLLFFCRFFLRNRCLWIFFSQVSLKAVVSAILIFSINGLSLTLHLLAETAARRLCSVAVVIDRLSADNACASRRSTGRRVNDCSSGLAASRHDVPSVGRCSRSGGRLELEMCSS